MAEKYYSILTNRGKELEAQSSATGKPVIIKDFVVGDGNGQAVKPDPAQTKLAREVYRNAISALQVSPDQANQFIAQLILPVNVGGFVVREVGLLTDAGELYSVANSAAIEKPENGVSVNLQYRLAVSETANIELKVATGDGLFLRIDKNLAEIAAKGEAAQKSSREAIGVLDATTAQKGIVQLSNATDNSSEALAATPKAVKAAYDLANSKYTAQDATTVKKGIVQLSSATDSTSETLAATPKAVKAANDNANGRVPSSRKINGHPLTDDTSVTAQDIFNGQAIGLSTEDLDALKTPGIYYQPANANTSAARHYPEINAGTLLVYKNAGVTQVYIVYNSSRTYTRSQYSTGAWTAWAKQYDTANKPTAGDVGALPSNGNAVSATKLQTARTIGGVAFNGTANINLPGVNTGGNQNTTGNAATATRLQNARTIAGVAFNGTANITIPAGNVGAYTKAECDARYGAGKTTTGSNSAYYTHGNGSVFMQSVRNISVANNATVTVTLPTSFPNGILGIGSSYNGSGGNNQASFYLCTPVGKNQIKIQTHNCNGTFYLNVTGY